MSIKDIHISGKSKNKGLLAYLSAVGVLEQGNEEQVKAAKKAYRKQYLTEFKRTQRTRDKEVTIKFEKGSGELKTIEEAAKKHQMELPSFIKTASLAYVRKVFVTPNRMQITMLQQTLANCLNEIQTIVSRKDSYLFQQEQKITDIEKRITQLETEIEQVLYQAIPIEEFIITSIKKEPQLKQRILTMLSK